MLVGVQDRYAGDVGDFLKYGLLRLLCNPGGVSRLGIVWYLVNDETHNADGRHVSYLLPGNRIGRRLRPCDPDLFDAMQTVVNSGERTVASIEHSGALPASTHFYSARLTRDDRAGWLRAALDRTRECDAVFLDPDNGISFGPQRYPEKYVDIDELAQFADRDQGIIVYQHCDRSAHVEAQARTLLQRVANAVAGDPLAAVIARRGTVRMFLLLPQPRQRDSFTAALRILQAGPWSSHLQPVYRD
jgi:hypothetical protein